MAHNEKARGQEPGLEELLTALQIMSSIQQLEAPARAREKEARQRAATLENLKLSLGAREAGRAPAKTDLPGLSALQSRFAASSGRSAELALDVDPNNPEEVKAFREKAALQNTQDGDFFRAMGQALLQKGDDPLAQMAFSLADSVDPPDEKEIERRGARSRAAKAVARKKLVGGFSVQGGPRSGFAARGTPEEILAELIATRSPELQAKFGGRTNTGAHPVVPPKNKITEKKKPRKTGAGGRLAVSSPRTEATSPIANMLRVLLSQDREDFGLGG